MIGSGVCGSNSSNDSPSGNVRTGGPPTGLDRHGFASHPTADEQAKLDAFYNGAEATPPLPTVAGERYAPLFLDSAITRRLPELYPEVGAGVAEQQTLRHDFIGLQRSTGLGEELMAKIFNGYIDWRLGEARSNDDEPTRAAALDAQIKADTATSRDHLRARYGVAHGEALLDRTIRWVKTHPGLAQTLRDGGLGSKPDIVADLAAHVFSTGWTG